MLDDRDGDGLEVATEGVPPGFRDRAARRLPSVVFGVAGLSTLVVSVVATASPVHSAASIISGMATLVGLCVLATGGADERPLRGVRCAMPLLMVAAASSIVKTVLLQAGQPLPSTVAIAAAVGVVGGIAVALAVVLLLLARARHRLAATTLIGLSAIAVIALTSNVLQVLGVPHVETHGLTAVTGAALLLIAAGLFLRPSGRRQP